MLILKMQLEQKTTKPDSDLEKQEKMRDLKQILV